jgi:hypothetical protein
VKSKIFLSRPASLTSIQHAIFTEWSSYLLELGFEVQQLRRHQYGNEPWDQVRKIIIQAHGVVAFGFSQFAVVVHERDSRLSRSIRTSPWVQIESAMAIAMTIPVLAVPEIGIAEGVFEPSMWSGCLYGIPAGVIPSRPAIPINWIDAVRLGHRERSSAER